MANGKLKRKQLNDRLVQQEKRVQESYTESEKKKAEYHRKVVHLKKVKEKYLSLLFQIKGIKAVGLKVYDEKIVVYGDDALDDKKVPKELDGYSVVVEKKSNIKPSPYVTWTSIDIYNDQYVRPLPPGHSIGHYAVTAGTLGSWWKDKISNRIIGITNNHVAGNENKAKGRRIVTSSIPCTVIAGTPIPTTPNSNLKYICNSYDMEQRESTIDSISPTSFAIGERVTIVGKSLGFSQRYSDVYFNGIKASIYSWSATGTQVDTIIGPAAKKMYYTNVTTTIVAIVPPGLSVGDQVTITVDVEGDTIIFPGRVDGGQMEYTSSSDKLTNHLGMLHKSLLVQAGGNADVSTIIPYNDSYVENRIFTRPGVGDEQRQTTQGGDLFPWRKNIDYYQPKGFAKPEEIIEGLAVIKTGRTTGTTCFQIKDANVTVSVDYGAPIGTISLVDCIQYSGYTKNGVALGASFAPMYFGDSGSSIFTCPPEWFHKFFDYYNGLGIVDIPLNTVFSQNNFAFIGNQFAVEYSAPLDGYSDNHNVWASSLGVDLAPLTFQISANATTFSDGRAAIDNTLYIRADGKTVTSGNSDLRQITYINIEDIMLEPYIVETDVDNLDFTLEVSKLELSGHASSISYGSASINIVKPQIVVNASGGSTSRGTATIKVITPLILAANGKSQIFGNATIRIITLTQPIILTANSLSISRGSATILLLPAGWEPSSQYEEITFEITRSIDLHFEITKTIDLNLAV